MKKSNIKSKLIYSVKYNFYKKHLDIETHVGDVYRYFNVPFIKYFKLKFSKSPGGFYVKSIKPSHQSELIRM